MTDKLDDPMAEVEKLATVIYYGETGLRVALSESHALARSLAVRLKEAQGKLEDIANGPQPIEDYKFGIRCGLEDRDLQTASPYVAAEYGYEKGLAWCASIAATLPATNVAETK